MADSLGPIFRANLEDLFRYTTGLLIQKTVTGYLPENSNGINAFYRVSKQILAPYGLDGISAPVVTKLRHATDEEQVGHSGPNTKNLAKIGLCFGMAEKPKDCEVVDASGQVNEAQRDRLIKHAAKATVNWLKEKGAFQEWKKTKGKEWKAKYEGTGGFDDVEPLPVVSVVPPSTNGGVTAGGVTPVTSFVNTSILTVERAVQLKQQDLSDLADEELLDLALAGGGAVQELYTRLQAAKEPQMSTPPHGHMLEDLIERKIHNKKSLAAIFEVDQKRLQEILDGSIMDARECEIAAGLINQSVDFLVRLGACEPCLDEASLDD